jgi:hypothetical protein
MEASRVDVVFAEEIVDVDSQSRQASPQPSPLLVVIAAAMRSASITEICVVAPSGFSAA